MLSAAPLRGVRVIEIGHSVAGPYAGMILGDLGADVIKIEPPGGDTARRWGPPFAGDDAALFAAVNRSKRSVMMDLRSREGRDELDELLSQGADVLLHNLKFGALHRLGLSEVAIRERYPSLILCNIGAYGHVGPLRDRPGYDPMIQAASGLMSLMGEDGGPPLRVPLSFIDMSTGLWAALGVLGALRGRDASGLGGVVDVSLYEAGLAWMGLPLLAYLASGERPRRLGSGHPTIVPTQAFQTADGWIMIAAGNDQQFAALAGAVEAPDLPADPRYATNPARVEHRGSLGEFLSARILLQPAAYWIERLSDLGVPCSPILHVDEVLAHPQTEALGIVQTSPTGGFAQVGLPLSFDGTRPRFERSAPALDEHRPELVGQAP